MTINYEHGIYHSDNAPLKKITGRLKTNSFNLNRSVGDLNKYGYDRSKEEITDYHKLLVEDMELLTQFIYGKTPILDENGQRPSVLNRDQVIDDLLSDYNSPAASFNKNPVPKWKWFQLSDSPKFDGCDDFDDFVDRYKEIYLTVLSKIEIDGINGFVIKDTRIGNIWSMTAKDWDLL